MATQARAKPKKKKKKKKVLPLKIISYKHWTEKIKGWLKSPLMSSCRAHFLYFTYDIITYCLVIQMS